MPGLDFAAAMNIVSSLVPVGFSIYSAISKAISDIQASQALDAQQKAALIAQLRGAVRMDVKEVLDAPVWDPREHATPVPAGTIVLTSPPPLTIEPWGGVTK